jgi:hypothetical protein
VQRQRSFRLGVASHEASEASRLIARHVESAAVYLNGL